MSRTVSTLLILAGLLVSAGGVVGYLEWHRRAAEELERAEAQGRKDEALFQMQGDIFSRRVSENAPAAEVKAELDKLVDAYRTRNKSYNRLRELKGLPPETFDEDLYRRQMQGSITEQRRIPN